MGIGLKRIIADSERHHGNLLIAIHTRGKISLALPQWRVYWILHHSSCQDRTSPGASIVYSI